MPVGTVWNREEWTNKSRTGGTPGKAAQASLRHFSAQQQEPASQRCGHGSSQGGPAMQGRGSARATQGKGAVDEGLLANCSQRGAWGMGTAGVGAAQQPLDMACTRPAA